MDWPVWQLLAVLIGLVVGELVWVVLFTWVAIWLRGSP